MSDLILLSPMDGWAASLDEAPDPVFADRMLGDGVAIDPTAGELHAPCAGQVIGVQRTLHAVTLRAANGAEILMHLGLETVGLGGEGFTAHVKDGQTVAAGDLLISFDLDLVARRAKSLISPIVITNGDDYVIADLVKDRLVKAGDPLMTLRGAGAVVEAQGGFRRERHHPRHRRAAAARRPCPPGRGDRGGGQDIRVGRQHHRRGPQRQRQESRRPDDPGRAPGRSRHPERDRRRCGDRGRGAGDPDPRRHRRTCPRRQAAGRAPPLPHPCRRRARRQG